MLAFGESLIILISPQPAHVQHDPAGESGAALSGSSTRSISSRGN